MSWGHVEILLSVFVLGVAGRESGEMRHRYETIEAWPFALQRKYPMAYASTAFCNRQYRSSLIYFANSVSDKPGTILSSIGEILDSASIE
jgi:hypothetical protein